MMPLGAAHAADDDAIPPDLRPWIPWVLSQRGEDVCTKLDGMPRCQWPGRLQLDLTSRGGEFQLEVFVETKGLVRLPGDTKSWPSEVRDGANELPILAQDELPVVELAAGAHTLRGQFAWRHLPETLSIGPHDAFVELTLEKRAVPLPKREGGELWLKGLDDAGSTSGEPEHLELDVFRKIHDGVPLVIESRLVFQVAGRAREIEFGTPLLPGTLPLSVSGDLAAALGRDGALRVQLTPGRHELIVVARSQGVPAQLDSPTRSAPWPEQETWVFEPNSALRAVELSGPPGIDASRTVLPEEWKQLAAFAVTPGQALALRTTRRGEPEIPPNRLTLRRELWLDDDAGGFTVRDDLSGTVQRDWRLDLLEGQLGQVRVGSEAQVITLAKDGTHRGVELREAALALRAVSRMPHQNELRAVGWSTNVDSLTATLHLPAGWDVLATSGVDEVQDTWIRRWDLFAVFYVLVLTLATAKLVGVPAGLVAFVTLVLCHDYDAPHYIWSVLLVLAALIGLVRAPRFAWVLRWSFRAASLTLAVMLLTFAVEQIRYALYPHLRDSYSQAVDESSKEGGSGARADVDRPEEAMAESAPPAAPAPVATEAAQELDSLRSMGRLGGSHASKRAATSSSSNYGSAPAQKQFQPGSIVQTGPGVPDVVSSSWELSWSGPVTSEHTIRLYLAPPRFMRLTTALRLVASGLLAYLFWRYAASRRPAPDSDAPPSHGSPSTDAGTPEAGISTGAVSEGASSANTPSAGTPIDAGTVRTTASVWASCLLLLGAWLAPGSASAAEPSDERLAQLTERLTQPAACTPNCLSIGRAKLRVQGSQLSYRAQAHAGDRVAYRLPGPAHALGAVELLVDGRATHDVRLEPDGAYYVRLTPGVHEVELRAAPDTDRLTLELGAVPHYLEVDSSDWVVTGVNDDGKVEGGTLTLARKLEPSQGETRATETRAQVVVPPWFTVARQLSIGVNGRVQTRVVRTSDPTSPEVLELPLLPGEQVTTPGIETRGGVAVLSFSREITEREFASTLPLTRSPARRFELSLLAPAQAPYSEIWRIECGIVWHCSASGLPTTSHVEGGRYLETYAPWPGEKLELIAEEPRSAPGQSLTIDSATLTISPG
ncbi:MAG TPA: hypothetical protein VLC09_03495, partial [Polyangiaceae bacterium]|nr:hypothetical protein [Polyangiaceae bacterium]